MDLGYVGDLFVENGFLCYIRHILHMDSRNIYHDNVNNNDKP